MNFSIYYVGRKASIGKASILRMTSTRLRAEAHERSLMLPDVIAGIPAILLGAAELCGALPGLKMETPRMPTTGPASTPPLIETHRVLEIYFLFNICQCLPYARCQWVPMAARPSALDYFSFFRPCLKFVRTLGTVNTIWCFWFSADFGFSSEPWWAKGSTQRSYQLPESKWHNKLTANISKQSPFLPEGGMDDHLLECFVQNLGMHSDSYEPAPLNLAYLWPSWLRMHSTRVAPKKTSIEALLAPSWKHCVSDWKPQMRRSIGGHESFRVPLSLVGNFG